jgi:hypothetical protein
MSMRKTGRWPILPRVPCWAKHVGLGRDSFSIHWTGHFATFPSSLTMFAIRGRRASMFSTLCGSFVQFPPDVHQAVALCRPVRMWRAGAVAYYLGHLAESAFSF